MVLKGPRRSWLEVWQDMRVVARLLRKRGQPWYEAWLVAWLVEARDYMVTPP